MRILVATAALLLTAACGGGDDSSGSSKPESKPDDQASSTSTPACAEVWKDGATLPKDYEGCTGPGGDLEAAATIDCDSGSGVFVTYQDEFFALLGGKITEADPDSPAYTKAYSDCFAG